MLDEELQPAPRGAVGVLAVRRAHSPLFTFTGYWKAETPSFKGDWYLTGDTMRQDEDGHYFFVGRNDDIITSAGYRIGPFDVESTIMEHPAVAEVAVIGKPDPERTEIVKAFVVLRKNFVGNEALAGELQNPCAHAPVAARLSQGGRLRRRIAEDAERQSAALHLTPARGGEVTSLTHIGASGEARMVDVSAKAETDARRRRRRPRRHAAPKRWR